MATTLDFHFLFLMSLFHFDLHAKKFSQTTRLFANFSAFKDRKQQICFADSHQNYIELHTLLFLGTFRPNYCSIFSQLMMVITLPRTIAFLWAKLMDFSRTPSFKSVKNTVKIPHFFSFESFYCVPFETWWFQRAYLELKGEKVQF